MLKNVKSQKKKQRRPIYRDEGGDSKASCLVK